MLWMVIAALFAVAASVCGLLSVRYCFGRGVMLFFMGASFVAFVLVLVLHFTCNMDGVMWR